MIRFLLAFYLFSATLTYHTSVAHAQGTRLQEELFKAVQMLPVFPDSKTFPDCIPKLPADSLLLRYAQESEHADFNLADFVRENYILPQARESGYVSDASLPLSAHIEKLWPVLTRLPGKVEGSSLLALPHPYVVPGGRFDEVYYWDSYFTMLGLRVSGQHKLIGSMLDNFAHLIDTLGFIPNGNRAYYATRSQPPFFALMVRLQAETDGDKALLRYRNFLEKEYKFWMDGAENPTATAKAYRRVVKMPDGSLLNRYWDDAASPRAEAYKEDVHIASLFKGDAETCYRHIRAACESGWDFSSRWLTDGRLLHTIHTTDIVPVDLNVLLYLLEQTIADAWQADDAAKAAQYRQKALQRAQAINKYCWNASLACFSDYDFVQQQAKNVVSAAMLFPLFAEIASDAHAQKTIARMKKDLLSPGGLLTTTIQTGQQWDAPNGWAPLQWIAFKGLQNYRQSKLANNIARRWLQNNERVYKNTGKMVEKYNVTDNTLKAGGGEYPLQDGFGWSNGVFLALKKELQRKK